MTMLYAPNMATHKFGSISTRIPNSGTKIVFMRSHPMSLETKRIKELFGYARTLTKEQGVGVMAGGPSAF